MSEGAWMRMLLCKLLLSTNEKWALMATVRETNNGESDSHCLASRLTVGCFSCICDLEDVRICVCQCICPSTVWILWAAFLHISSTKPKFCRCPDTKHPLFRLVPVCASVHNWCVFNAAQRDYPLYFHCTGVSPPKDKPWFALGEYYPNINYRYVPSIGLFVSFILCLSLQWGLKATYIISSQQPYEVC